MTRYVVGLALASLALLTGCGATASSAGQGPVPTPRESAASPAPYTPPATPIPHLGETVAKRCGVAVPGSVFPLRGLDRRTQLAAAQLGSGPEVAVLLHQTDGDGLCGWLPYARFLATQGVRALMVDQCDYGESVCSDQVRRDPPAMLGAAVRWARNHGARRVTVVGASMGGSVALGTGQAAGADAIVDLSGPPYWYGTPGSVSAARRVRVPLLVAVNKGTDPDSFAPLRRAVHVAPSRVKRFLAAPPGHGWSLLTEPDTGATSTLQDRPTALGRLVLAWIRGIG